MTPDALTFELVDGLAAISVSLGHVSFLHGNDLYDITHTNIGRWLLATQGLDFKPGKWFDLGGIRGTIQ